MPFPSFLRQTGASEVDKNMHQTTCSECGREYRTSNNAKTTLCPDCRKKPDMSPRTCACGRVYKPVRSNQKFCCLKCKRKLDKKADRFRKVCALLECQSEFMGTRQQRYCSANCASLAHRASYTNIRPRGPEDYVE